MPIGGHWRPPPLAIRHSPANRSSHQCSIHFKGKRCCHVALLRVIQVYVEFFFSPRPSHSSLPLFFSPLLFSIFTSLLLPLCPYILGYSWGAGGGSLLLTAPLRQPSERMYYSQCVIRRLKADNVIATDGSPGWKEAASAQPKTTAEPNIKFQNTVGVTQNHSTTAPWRPASRTCVSRIDNGS